MYLKDKQLIEYRDKLDRISAPHQCILQRSGIFEINLLDEIDATSIYNKISRQPYIADVRKIETSKYDFNHMDFKTGTAQPKKFYSIRGILKEIEEDIEYKNYKIVPNYASENHSKVLDYKIYGPDGTFLWRCATIELAKKSINKEISNNTNEESLTEALPEGNIEDYIITTENPILTSSYIMPDGSFININEICRLRHWRKNSEYLNFFDHYDFIQGLKAEGILDADYDSLDIPDDYGWIRTNIHDGFVHLPNKEITTDQYAALTTLLDLTSYEKDSVEVGDKSAYNITYYFDETPVDEIINKIKVFYKSGVLTEGLETSEPVKNITEDIEKHDTLNPKLWNADNTLKSEVKDKILEIANDFIDGLAEDEITFNLVDIKLVGSNCSYNYNKDSDLDLHLVADTKSLHCPDNLYPLLYSAYRSIWNKNHEISFYGIPVEIFVETDDTEQEVDVDPNATTEINEEINEARQQSSLKSNGIYSVLHDKWIKEPVAEDIPEIDMNVFNEKYQVWENKYFEVKDNPSTEAIEKFINDIYDLRKTSIAEEGEYGIGNLIFKECRARGYLDDLRSIKAEIRNKELSLESLNK